MILLRMRDPNSVAVWYADLIAIWKNHETHNSDNMKIPWLEAYKLLNTSLVLKMHGRRPFELLSRGMLQGVAADLTVIAHRDLRQRLGPGSTRTGTRPSIQEILRRLLSEIARSGFGLQSIS